MAYSNPSVSDFKSYFNRDFPYGSTEVAVMDSDITRAMEETAAFINQGLFFTQAIYNIGFLLLSAHNLVMNLRASSQGLSGQYSWLQTSKSVGSVAEAFSIPDRILNDPLYAMYSKTTYGAKYLGMILPQLNGQVFVVLGDTLP